MRLTSHVLIIGVMALGFGSVGQEVGVRPPAGPAPLTNSIGMTLLPVPAGEFMMGSTSEEAQFFTGQMRSQRVAPWYLASPPSEVPQHAARISKPYYSKRLK